MRLWLAPQACTRRVPTPARIDPVDGVYTGGRSNWVRGGRPFAELSLHGPSAEHAPTPRGTRPDPHNGVTPTPDTDSRRPPRPHIAEAVAPHRAPTPAPSTLVYDVHCRSACGEQRASQRPPGAGASNAWRCRSRTHSANRVIRWPQWWVFRYTRRARTGPRPSHALEDIHISRPR